MAGAWLHLFPHHRGQPRPRRAGYRPRLPVLSHIRGTHLVNKEGGNLYDCGLTGRAQNRTVAWDRAGPCLAMRRGSRQAGRDGNRASIFAVRGVWTANNYRMKSIIRSHPMTTVYVMQIGGYAGCWGSRLAAETVSSSRGWLSSSNGCTAALRPSRVDNIIPRGRPSRTTLRCGVGDVTIGLPRDKGFVMNAHSALGLYST